MTSSLSIILAVGSHQKYALSMNSNAVHQHLPPHLIVKVVLKGYRIRRASASACTLCPFPEYSPLFQNTVRIVSEDPDGYCSVSEGPDDYRMISGYRDK
jgi:hypothetical protein